jgi:predicted nucleotidyltransferase
LSNLNPEPVIHRAIDLIIQCLAPEAIALFGSVAQGRMRVDSDLDFLVIGDFREPKPRRGLELKGLLGQLPLPIDLHLLTFLELRTEAKEPFSVMSTVLHQGVWVYFHCEIQDDHERTVSSRILMLKNNASSAMTMA